MKQIVLFLMLPTVLTYSQIFAKHPAIPKDGVIPKQGFVSNPEVAVAIAEAVLIPVYGKNLVASERPFKATLNGDSWRVTRKVPCDGPPHAVCPGGAGEVWISKRNGRILYMTHDQ